MTATFDEYAVALVDPDADVGPFPEAYPVCPYCCTRPTLGADTCKEEACRRLWLSSIVVGLATELGGDHIGWQTRGDTTYVTAEFRDAAGSLSFRDVSAVRLHEAGYNFFYPVIRGCGPWTVVVTMIER